MAGLRSGSAWRSREIVGEKPLPDWPAGMITAGLCLGALYLVVVAAAIVLRVVSFVLGGVYLETAIAQIAAFVIVTVLSYFAVDSLRAARQNALRAGRLRKVVEAAVNVAAASSSPQDWVEKLLVFSVQTVDADRSSMDHPRITALASGGDLT